MKTRPRYQSVDALAEQAVGLCDPCAMLVESGPAFSVLFAQRIVSPEFGCRSPESAKRPLRLEGVFQLRISEIFERVFRRFESVDVYNRDGVWLAEVSGTGSVFSMPSVDPYRVIYLKEETYTFFRTEAYHGRSDLIFTFCRINFGSLPGFFSPEQSRLITPAHYACAEVEIDGLRVEI